MTKQPQSHAPVQEQQEPMGLVISLGAQPEVTPRFWAYVWSDVPEVDHDAPARRAA